MDGSDGDSGGGSGMGSNNRNKITTILSSCCARIVCQ